MNDQIKKKNNNKVAVIIVAYNAANDLADCLQSLQNYQDQGVDWELVLVDNNSQDNSIDITKKYFPHATILAQKQNYGFAKGNNIGIEWAIKNNYDYVFLLNQDTIVDSQWLAPLFNKINTNHKIAAVQAKLMLYPQTDRVNSVGNIIHYLGFGYCSITQRTKDNKKVNYCSGAAVLYRVSTLQEVGLFDEGFFMYHEDLDLGWRLWLAGYQSVIETKSIIYHKYSFTTRQKMIYYMERNRWLVFFKNYQTTTILLILPAFLLMEVGQLLFAVIRGWWWQKIKTYLYFTDPQVWFDLGKKRKQLKKIRKKTDGEMLEMFSGVIDFQAVNNVLLTYIANPLFVAYLYFLRMTIK